MDLYPLLMSPAFQHGADTPWGGTMLRDIFMKDAPDEPTGASLEACAQPGLESLVGNGPHAGKALSRMVELWGEALTGTADGKFPLLVKLLDTQQPLSVQVCPDDAEKSGRSAAWVILNAEPGAKIVYGLEDGVGDPRALLAEDRVAESLHWEPARVSDVFYIPAGMAHAVGAGIQCYEIQDSGELSYRLWDWDRGREVHIEQALEALKPGLRRDRNEGTTALCKGGSRTYYVSDRHFELCRLNLSGRMPLESGRMLALTALAPCAIQWPGGELEIAPFATVIVPAALEGVALAGNAKLMMASLPEREPLRELLGYRAENVAGLVD